MIITHYININKLNITKILPRHRQRTKGQTVMETLLPLSQVSYVYKWLCPRAYGQRRSCYYDTKTDILLQP